jgi:hypothetical protein
MKIPRRMKKNFKEKTDAGWTLRSGWKLFIRGNDQWKLDAKSNQKINIGCHSKFPHDSSWSHF